MKRYSLLALLLLFSSPTWAACSGYPYTLTNGSTADATQVMSNFNAVMNCASTAQGTPQGRLTLTSNTPVMTADATAQSTVYYDCYAGNSVPIYDGTTTGSLAVGSCEISLTLNSANQTSGNLYDIFAFNNSGTLTLCAGPAWTSGTTRSAGITISLGYWTNSSGLTHCYNGATDYGTISANQATYLGTLYATANGQTGMAFKPAPAAGGSAPILGLYNAYNRVNTTSLVQDSTSSWTYSSVVWRKSNNSSNNSITYIDGTAQSPISAIFDGEFANAGSQKGELGIERDWSSGTPSGITGGQNSASMISIKAINSWPPLIGLHTINALEFTSGVSTTFIGASGTPGGGQSYGMIVQLNM